MHRSSPSLWRSLQLVSLFVFCLGPALAASPVDAALQEGRIDQAIAQLRSAVSANPSDALSHNLLCRALYAEEQADSAVQECEAAVARDATNSDFALWLGRVYGMKADHSGPLTGYSMAKRVRAMFEKAVQLDPKNAPAMSDLGEFYVNAPGIVGGGYDKAQRLADRMMLVSASRAHRLLGQLANKKGDTGAAEREFKAAVSAERSPATLVDLGLFYQQHNRYDEAAATLKSAIDLDSDNDFSIVDVASILTDMKREPKLAATLFQRYLASPARSEAVPAPRVHLLFGRLLKQTGDTAGARREFEAALALASGYGPARTELGKL